MSSSASCSSTRKSAHLDLNEASSVFSLRCQSRLYFFRCFESLEYKRRYLSKATLASFIRPSFLSGSLSRWIVSSLPFKLDSCSIYRRTPLLLSFISSSSSDIRWAYWSIFSLTLYNATFLPMLRESPSKTSRRHLTRLRSMLARSCLSKIRSLSSLSFCSF